MSRHLPSLVGRSVAVAALFVCVVGADGDTGAGAVRAPGSPVPAQAQAVPAAGPLVLEDLAFMACRDRRGVAAYLWCSTIPTDAGASGSGGPVDRPAEIDPLAAGSSGGTGAVQ